MKHVFQLDLSKQSKDEHFEEVEEDDEKRSILRIGCRSLNDISIVDINPASFFPAVNS